MLLAIPTLLLSLLAILPIASAQNQTHPKTYLNLTAITGRDGESVLECWEVGPLITSAVPGTAGAAALFLGDMSNATYTVIPPRFDGGEHVAPALQLVFFVSGLVHVTIPNRTEEAWVQGGKYGLVISADTADVSRYGHRSVYPGNEATVALQVPVKGELKHSVLHRGVCEWEEMVGL
ncbi:hypothetical protein GE09DRAFT_1161779 [Coniochaeta sp. 2T2.1]|nr:hypothetical protein GE09DRAFT_1161779 [Coniochaeta sp. 2T2.1]